MKVGVNLLNYGPGASPDSLLRWTQLAESLGYHCAMISDHIAITPDVAEVYPAPFYDPFLTLAWLAGQTRRIELGTTVIILPYRHPLQAARLASNLDQFSGGRFIFGVGVGWAAEEFEALGLSVHQRGAMTDEYLDVILATWRAEVVSHHGRFINFDQVQTGPPPIQRPHPPVWVGGNREPARRRAVRCGVAWHPISMSLRRLRDEALPDLRAVAEAAGKPVPPVCPRIRLHLTDQPLDEATRGTGEGSLEQIHADLRGLEALGAAYVLLDPYDGRPETTSEHERAWSTLALLAERALDLPNQRVR